MSVNVELTESAQSGPTRPRRWPRRARPLLPVEDPFFDPPREFAAHQPGALIRSREIKVAAFGRIPQQIQAWQLLYRSTDLDGHPEAAVTTVLLPRGADPTIARPVLAYQCAIDAVTSRSFPSYLLQYGARTSGSAVPVEFLFIGGALRAGWAVVVTDHEGMGGRFGAPREPGYRVLDGVRAALDFEPLGLDPNTPVAAWGYSGGGMATSWVVEMAPSYAPEINLVGGVLGAPVGDPHSAFWRLNGGFHAGLAALVIAALRRSYPALANLVHNHVTLEGRRRLELADRLTTVAAVLRFARDDFDDFVDAPLRDLLSTPEITAMFDEMQLGNRKPGCPLLVIQPVHDQIISVHDIDAQVQRYLDHGADVQYVRDRMSEHLSGLPFSVPLSLAWITARFAGLPTTPGTKTVRSITTEKGTAAMWLTIGRMLAGLPLTGRQRDRRDLFRRRRQLPHRRAG